MALTDRKRVVVTGLGVVAANGIGVDAFWQANIMGRSGAGPVTCFDASHYDSRIAAEVKGFRPEDYIPDKVAKRVDRFVHFGMAAASMAIKDSSLDLEKEDRTRIGVILGSGLGGAMFHEEQMALAYEKGSHRFNPLSVPRVTPNAVAAHIAIENGLRGPNMVVSTACASGNHGIGEALRKIQHGEADVMLAGGAEAPLTQFTYGAYCAMRSVLSKRNESPEEASRPFDKDRDGFVMGEGGAVLILEEMGRAIRRGARIYAELAGYGLTSGAYHIAMPQPDGEDAAEAMALALKDAGVDIEDVDYINAHGTSTVANDVAETRGIKRLFGKTAYRIPISSTKSMVGHSIGAAGAIEAVVCCLAIANRLIPPTINYRTKDPECDLDYVPNEAREAELKTVLSNAFGFGSVNACLVFRKCTL
jgi:3-oxoacyl-[acyl-carrier-protein] synthase II